MGERIDSWKARLGFGNDTTTQAAGNDHALQAGWADEAPATVAAPVAPVQAAARAKEYFRDPLTLAQLKAYTTDSDLATWRNPDLWQPPIPTAEDEFFEYSGTGRNGRPVYYGFQFTTENAGIPAGRIIAVNENVRDYDPGIATITWDPNTKDFVYGENAAMMQDVGYDDVIHSMAEAVGRGVQAGHQLAQAQQSPSSDTAAKRIIAQREGDIWQDPVSLSMPYEYAGVEYKLQFTNENAATARGRVLAVKTLAGGSTLEMPIEFDPKKGAFLEQTDDALVREIGLDDFAHSIATAAGHAASAAYETARAKTQGVAR